MKDPVLVLYVEDEESDAFLVTSAFKRQGVQNSLKIVQNGDAAVQYLSRVLPPEPTEPQPTMVLLDVHLPGASGFDVLKWIRGTPEFASLPVVMLSSSADPRDVERARVLGANGFMLKGDRCQLEDLVADLHGC